MIESQTWKRYAVRIALGVSGGLLLLSGGAVVSALTSDAGAEQDAQIASDLAELTQDAENAEAELSSEYAALLEALPAVDPIRLEFDQDTLRSTLLSLTTTSVSTRDLGQEQVLLDERQEFWDETSVALTQFLPEWLALTNGDDGPGTAFALIDFDVSVTGITGLTYDYVGTAVLEQIGAVKVGEPQLVTFTATTTPDGAIASFDAWLSESASTSAEASPSPKPSTTSS